MSIAKILEGNENQRGIFLGYTKDKDGNDKYTTEVLGNEMNMLGGRMSSGDNSNNSFDQSAQTSQTPQAQPVSVPSSEGAIGEEDIPF